MQINLRAIARTDGRVEIAKVASYKSREVSTANARLIAAAPELAALTTQFERIVTKCLAGGYNHQMAAWHRLAGESCEQARALLAKINS